MSFEVQKAHLSWEDNLPSSVEFEDIYYSKQNGLDESRYVFLDANRITSRLASPDSKNSAFTIAETGFGTGLNFLATLQAWEGIKTPKKNLHYFAVEKYPLDKASLEQALSVFGELDSQIRLLLSKYPLPIKGPHTLSFHEGQVKLTLVFGDVLADFRNYHFIADAWYLDGFNPSKNPEMWSEELFETIGRHSARNASFSTFTAAGFVRRGLQNHGYAVNKVKGFGAKKIMLAGHRDTDRDRAPSYFSARAKAWSTSPQSNDIPLPKERDVEETPYDAVVVGAGLAGITSARNLAERGFRTLILDQRSGPVAGASGQSSLIMYSKLPSIFNREAKLIVACTGYSQSYFEQIQQRYSDLTFWHKFGVLQLDWSEQEKKRNLQRTDNLGLPQEFMKRVDAAQASTLSGIPLSKGGLWFPKNGLIKPAVFASTCLKHPNITAEYSAGADQISYSEKNQCWHITCEKNTYSGRHLVLANSYDAERFEQSNQFPTKAIRGQTSSIKHQALTQPECIVCGEGYLSPDLDGSQHIGATYDLNNLSEVPRTKDHLTNIETLASWLPEWADRRLLQQASFESIAGIRCTSADYQPIVGRIPQKKKMQTDFAKLKVDAKSCDAVSGSYFPNLYVNIGHGSKGVVTAPISAEIIGSLIQGTPAPLETQLIEMLCPSRFIIRDLIKGRT